MLTVWQAMSPEGAGAEVIPAAPLERLINVLLEGPLARRPEPHIPVQVGRNRVRALRAVKPLGPDRAIGPDMHFERIADHAGLDDFDRAAQAGSALPWLPIWVARFFSLATCRIWRAS